MDIGEHDDIDTVTKEALGQASADATPGAERVARALLDGVLAGDALAIRATLADDAVLVLPRPTCAGNVVKGASLRGWCDSSESPESSP